jgi:CheY-like chemotaxis protein
MKNISDTTTILVIDRDPLILTGMGAILDQQGYGCWLARGSEAAMKFAATGTPDLIICDTHLGDECGLELVSKLLTRPNLIGTPVVFTTGSAHADLIDRTRSVGGSYCLRKPFDPYVLLEIVDKALWMTALVQTRIDRGTDEQPAPKDVRLRDKSRAMRDRGALPTWSE